MRLLVCCSSKRKGFDRDLIHARSLLDRGLFDRDTNGPAIDLMKQNLASASISLGTDSPQSETDEFDFEKRLWTIAGERRKTRGKTSEPHLVPLTDLHIQILDEIRSTTHDPRFLFPSRGTDGPRRYDSLTKPVSIFVKQSGMPSFSARDLRRTFKTLAGSMGISLEMRNRLQGHALVDVGSVYYDRFDYLDQKRNSMQVWAIGLTKIIGSKDEG